jgi:hypothetical protein
MPARLAHDFGHSRTMSVFRSLIQKLTPQVLTGESLRLAEQESHELAKAFGRWRYVAYPPILAVAWLWFATRLLVPLLLLLVLGPFKFTFDFVVSTFQAAADALRRSRG